MKTTLDYFMEVNPMVKIRLRRMGAKKAPYYRIVVADARSPRDGRCIEEIGTYNPLTNPATITVDAEKAQAWIKNGAQPTDTVRGLLKSYEQMQKMIKQLSGPGMGKKLKRMSRSFGGFKGGFPGF